MTKKNPLEVLGEHEKTSAAARRKNELDMLERWRAGGKQPEDLAPLMKAYEPVVQRKMTMWKAPTVPEAAFRAELQGHMIRAFETYDPSRGAALNTHVENGMRRAMRYNAKNQNFAYIPEEQIDLISPINRARDILKEDHGRDPTVAEIAQHLNRSPKVIQRVLQAQRKDVADSTFASEPDDVLKHLSRDREVLALLPHELSADEKTVFNHLYGLEGHRQIDSTNELAKALGKTAPQVSRMKSSILAKYKQYR